MRCRCAGAPHLKGRITNPYFVCFGCDETIGLRRNRIRILATMCGKAQRPISPPSRKRNRESRDHAMIDIEKSMFALSGLCAAGLLALHLAASGGHVAAASMAGGTDSVDIETMRAVQVAVPAAGGISGSGRAAACGARRWPNIPPECLTGDEGIF